MQKAECSSLQRLNLLSNRSSNVSYTLNWKVKMSFWSFVFLPQQNICRPRFFIQQCLILTCAEDYVWAGRGLDPVSAECEATVPCDPRLTRGPQPIRGQTEAVWPIRTELKIPHSLCFASASLASHGLQHFSDHSPHCDAFSSTQ